MSMEATRHTTRSAEMSRLRRLIPPVMRLAESRLKTTIDPTRRQGLNGETDSYRPRPLVSWLSRLWRTLAFRPGAYTEMVGDRHAAWQAAATWVVASVGPAFTVLVYDGPVLGGVLQVFLGSVVALVLWNGIVHIASRLLSKGGRHLVACPECANRISAVATTCPPCGFPLADHGGLEPESEPTSHVEARNPGNEAPETSSQAW